MEPSDQDKIPLCKTLYFVGGTGLLAEWRTWEDTTDQKMVAVQESTYAPTPLSFIHYVSFFNQIN
jgi:hypothetical protein